MAFVLIKIVSQKMVLAPTEQALFLAAPSIRCSDDGLRSSIWRFFR